MKVKLLTSIAGRENGRQYSYESGQVVDIADETAKRMIAKGRAVVVEAEKPTAKSKKDAD